jgi:peptide deformylase
MAILEVRTFPDPILREKAAPVTVFDEPLKRLARDMAETMYAAPGVGLAANQVGVAKQLIVVHARDEEVGLDTGLLTLVNPRIVEASGELHWEEGCLSVPDERDEVERFARVRVQAQDLDGREFELIGEGLAAVVLQHEIDHLNGVLFIDRLSPLKRAAIKKRQRRARAPAAAG